MEHVPNGEEHMVMKRGARWDSTKNKWYVPKSRFSILDYQRWMRPLELTDEEMKAQ